jgi:hypothetical protein
VDLAEIPSVPANLAKQHFDSEVAAALAQYGTSFDPAAKAWQELDAPLALSSDAARKELASALSEAIEIASRGGEVDDALLMGSARQALLAGEDVPVPPPVGRPLQGARKHDGHSYLLIEEQLDWHAARERCTELGGVLACAETPEELEYFASLTKDWTWLGASDAEQEGNWKWLSGETVAVPWEAGQPDNAGSQEHAAALTGDGKLHDRYALETSAFLCEWGEQLPKPWSFESHPGRNAKERYDKDCRKALADREAQRERLRDSLERQRNACLALVAVAERDLEHDLEEAVRAELRLGHSEIALELRAARAAVGEGAYSPFVPLLGAPPVPDDAVRLGRRRFKLFPEDVTWRVARERCLAMGGRLAEARPGEVDFFRSLAGAGCWIGARRHADGRFLWESGAVVQQGWQAGEPSNSGGREDAVGCSPGGWNDYPSENRGAYLCEWY